MLNVVFGDTGGHYRQLSEALKTLNIDPRSGIIPKGIRIIHLGDIIHKGPHSSILLRMVDRFLAKNDDPETGEWIQLFGNHEFQHIDESIQFWRCDCTYEDTQMLKRWRRERTGHAAYGIDTATALDNDVKTKLPFDVTLGFFFSHAGLTKPNWKKIGSPTSAEEAGKLVDASDRYYINNPGEMLTGVVNYGAGVIWATGSKEVYGSWTHDDHDASMPFSQMHGHSLSFNWNSKSWWASHDADFKRFRRSSKVSEQDHAVYGSVGNTLLIGIDPGYSKEPNTLVQPYVTFVSND